MAQLLPIVRRWRWLAAAVAALAPASVCASPAATGSLAAGPGPGIAECGHGPALGYAAARPAEIPSALERMRQSQEGDAPTVAPAAAATAPAICAARDIAAAAAFPAPGDDSELGTIAIPVSNTRFDERWARVRHAPSVTLMQSELQRAGVTSGLEEIEILDRVNKWVNHRIAYAKDDRNYRQSDFWATAEQTIARGSGDCEDYAVLKMQMLLAAGIDPRRVKLVLLRDLALNADHALLLVRSTGGKLVLDNLTDRLYDGGQSTHLRPILSFSGSKSWVHGYRDRQSAATPVDRAIVAPRERMLATARQSFRFGPGMQRKSAFHSARLSVLYNPD